MKNRFYHKRLNAVGNRARDLAYKICKVLSIESGRRFYVKMNCEKNIYEAHIIDTGHCIAVNNYDYELTNDVNAEEIGSIFFGGYYSRLKYKDAEERAWMSLILDCIGQSEDVEIREFHNLTNALATFGPCLNLYFRDVEELEKFLNKYGV